MDAAELKRRTKRFALQCMAVADRLPETKSGRTVGNQLVRSGTSVAANYRSANRFVRLFSSVAFTRLAPLSSNPQSEIRNPQSSGYLKSSILVALSRSHAFPSSVSMWTSSTTFGW